MTSISDKAIALRGEPKPQEPKIEKVCDKCGQKLPHQRNSQRHKLLFASLPAIFRHWPETEKWQPRDTESLRAWLLIDVGHFITKEHYFPGKSKSQVISGVAAFLMDPDVRKAQKFEEIPDGIRAFIPRSIAYHKCSEKTFQSLLDKVTEVVEVKTGIPFDQLKREFENEA